MRHAFWIVCVATVSIGVVVPFVGVTRVRGQTKWDGLDELPGIAAAAEIELEVGPAVDLSRLSANDALLIIGPTRALPVSTLTAFLREGGRVALFDDVGRGERLLTAYQVSRSPSPKDAPALRDDADLLLAYPASEHPLVSGVSVLLTNRATTLRHPELKPVFTFGRTPHALVLAGAVGSGRLVAVGDASLFINQMMVLPSHRRFATNVLEYLARPSGRVWLIGPETDVAGTYGASRSGLARVDAFLKRVAHPDLPPAVLLLIALAISAIVAVLAASTLPRRSPYVRADLFPKAAVFAGFAGRIAVAERGDVNLVWPLLDYRRELEAELSRRLGLKAPFDLQQALSLVRARGLSGADISDLTALFEKLDQVAASAEAEMDDKKARVDVSELRNVVRKGEELLARLGNDRE